MCCLSPETGEEVSSFLVRYKRISSCTPFYGYGRGVVASERRVEKRGEKGGEATAHRDVQTKSPPRARAHQDQKKITQPPERHNPMIKEP
jgi:hypothetical protein